MGNIEKIKKKLLKVPESEVKANTFDKQILEDFRRDFPTKNKKRDFREACDSFKKYFYGILTSLKKYKQSILSYSK